MPPMCSLSISLTKSDRRCGSLRELTFPARCFLLQTAFPLPLQARFRALPLWICLSVLRGLSLSGFARLYPDSICTQNKVSFLLCGNVNKLLGELNQYDVEDILVRNQTIEEIFQQYYRGDKSDIFIDEKRV